MDNNNGANIFSILVASIVFVLGLILNFVASPYSFAFLCSIAAIIFIIATISQSRTMMQLSIFALIVCIVFTLWPLLYLTGDGSLLSRYEHNNFRTYAYITIYLVVPLLIALLITSIIHERSVHSAYVSNKFILIMINSAVFKIVSLLLASTVFCIGFALPFIDKLFLFAPIVSFASISFVINMKKPAYKRSIICTALLIGYVLSLRLAYFCLFLYEYHCKEILYIPEGHGKIIRILKPGAIDIKQYTDATFGKWPVNVHNVDLYILILPIAIMACLSFIQTVSLYQTQNEQTGSYTTSEYKLGQEGES